jgi:hypothetical protein
MCVGGRGVRDEGILFFFFCSLSLAIFRSTALHSELKGTWRERVRERVCVRERENVCVREREREREEKGQAEREEETEEVLFCLPSSLPPSFPLPPPAGAALLRDGHNTAIFCLTSASPDHELQAHCLNCALSLSLSLSLSLTINIYTYTCMYTYIHIHTYIHMYLF